MTAPWPSRDGVTITGVRTIVTAPEGVREEPLTVGEVKAYLLGEGLAIQKVPERVEIRRALLLQSRRCVGRGQECRLTSQYLGATQKCFGLPELATRHG